MGELTNLLNFKYSDEILTENDIFKIGSFDLPYAKEIVTNTIEGINKIILVNKDKYYLTEININIYKLTDIIYTLLGINNNNNYNIFKMLELLDLTVHIRNINNNVKENSYFNNNGISFTKADIDYILYINIKNYDHHSAIIIKENRCDNDQKELIKSIILRYYKNKKVLGTYNESDENIINILMLLNNTFNNNNYNINNYNINNYNINNYNMN